MKKKIVRWWGSANDRQVSGIDTHLVNASAFDVPNAFAYSKVLELPILCLFGQNHALVTPPPVISDLFPVTGLRGDPNSNFDVSFPQMSLCFLSR